MFCPYFATFLTFILVLPPSPSSCKVLCSVLGKEGVRKGDPTTADLSPRVSAGWRICASSVSELAEVKALVIGLLCEFHEPLLSTRPSSRAVP